MLQHSWLWCGYNVTDLQNDLQVPSSPHAIFLRIMLANLRLPSWLKHMRALPEVLQHSKILLR